MRALIISTTGFLGGGEIALNTLLGYLSREKGMEFIIVSQPGEAAFTFSGSGFETKEEDFTLRKVMEIRRRILNFTARLKPDFILVNGRKGAIFLPSTEVPSYIWLHLPFRNDYDGTMKSRFMFNIARHTLKKFRKIFYVSEDIGNELRKLGFDNIKKLYPPLDTSKLNDKGNIDVLNLNEGQGLVISYIARIERVKGQIKVAKYLKKTRVLEKFSALLVFAGKGKLLRKLKNYEGGRIKVLGHINDVRSLLKASDIYFLFSRAEGLPLSMLEAMYYGVIPLVRPVGEIPYIIKDGINGVIINKLKDIEEKIEIILKNKDKLKQKVTEEARRFSAEKISNEFMEAICI